MGRAVCPGSTSRRTTWPCACCYLTKYLVGDGLNVNGPMASRIVAYDDFMGDHLDDDRWTYLTIPGRGASEPWTCFEPPAETRVGEGTLDLFVPRFTSRLRRSPTIGNIKRGLLSRSGFSTSDGVAVFALDMAVTRVGEMPTDYGDGFASFMLIDAASGWSFQVCCNGYNTFGFHDSPHRTYRPHQPTTVIFAPAQVPGTIGRSRRHEIIIDSRDASVGWWADGKLASRVEDADIPASLHIALGLATLISARPIAAEPVGYASGLSVSFGPVAVRSATNTQGRATAGAHRGQQPHGSNR
jgi:Family of unknown function (DUF6081)